jgi:probable rRNA maturation factor
MSSDRPASVAGLDEFAMRVATKRRTRSLALPKIEFVVNSPLWRAQRSAKTIVRRAVGAAAAEVSTTSGELAIVLTDDSSIRALNRDWRGKDEATNVLSFPIATADADDRIMVLLGDIVIAYETTAHEALAANKPFGHHLAHLAVHGFLHLVGYDHETDQEAEVMENLEAVVLARLDVPNPYAARDAIT